MKNFPLWLILSLISFCRVFGQDTLPNFRIINSEGKVIISWQNEYSFKVKIINIQRSKDSTKGYSTIGEVPDPQKKENRFIDTRPPADNMFYRIFIAFDGGSFAFTKIVRPMKNGPFPNEMMLAYPSGYVYTGKNNNVYISLPDAEKKKYKLKFFDEGYKPVFAVNRLRESFLVIEKVNFMHAGWFYFELYENGKLVEKNKFIIAAD